MDEFKPSASGGAESQRGAEAAPDSGCLAERQRARPMFRPDIFPNPAASFALALAEFRRGGQRGDGGRAGMRMALHNAFVLMGMHIEEDERELLQPIVALMDALGSLEGGAVHPALMPRHRGRPRSRDDVQQFKAACLAASDALHEADRAQWPRTKADKEITRIAGEAARKLGVRMTGNSLGTWRRRIARATGPDGMPRDFPSFIAWANRQTLSEMQATGLPLSDQLSWLLRWFSPDALSHLPRP